MILVLVLALSTEISTSVPPSPYLGQTTDFAQVGLQLTTKKLKLVTGHINAYITVAHEVPYIKHKWQLPPTFKNIDPDMREIQETSKKGKHMSYRPLINHLHTNMLAMQDTLRNLQNRAEILANESYILNDTIGVFLHSKIVKGRRRRYLNNLAFDLGEFAGTIFGLMTNKDRKVINKQLHIISHNQRELEENLKSVVSSLVAYVNVSHNRLHNMDSRLNLTWHSIRLLGDEVSNLYRKADDMYIQISYAFKCMQAINRYTHLIEFLEGFTAHQYRFLQAVRTLQTGELTPDLIPPTLLSTTLDALMAKVEEHRPGYTLLFHDTESYYLNSLASYKYSGSTLYAFLLIPLVNRGSIYILRETTTYPVALHPQNPKGYSQLQDVPAIFGLSLDNHYYIELSEHDVKACRKGSVYICAKDFPRYLRPRLTCVAAIFFKEWKKALQICNILIYPETPLVASAISAYNNTYYVTIPTRKYTLRCGDISTIVHALTIYFSLHLTCDCHADFEGIQLISNAGICNLITNPDMTSEVSPISNFAILYATKLIFPEVEITDEFDKDGIRMQAGPYMAAVIESFQDLTVEDKRLGISLDHIVHQVQIGSDKFKEDLGKEFFLPEYVFNSSGTGSALILVVIWMLLLTIGLCWVMKKGKLLRFMTAVALPQTSHARPIFLPHPQITPSSQIAIVMPDAIEVMGYLLFICVILGIIYKLHALLFYSRHTSTMARFLIGAKGTAVYLRISAEGFNQVLFMGIVPLNFATSDIAIVPYVIQAQITQYCLWDSVRFMWSSKLNISRLGIFLEFKLPTYIRLSKCAGKKLRVLLSLNRPVEFQLLMDVAVRDVIEIHHVRLNSSTSSADMPDSRGTHN